jgi:hypothetical protein
MCTRVKGCWVPHIERSKPIFSSHFGALSRLLGFRVEVMISRQLASEIFDDEGRRDKTSITATRKRLYSSYSYSKLGIETLLTRAHMPRLRVPVTCKRSIPLTYIIAGRRELFIGFNPWQHAEDS